ncbi:flavin-containing monooxygenase [Amycolatopsis pithecellobii]|uniref:4-hydroxybenzoate brominase (decarboxylating) n=1 Tax=Amycolatopsis pithecellobii TaxID=664692 RepID=A0A6N7YZH0_9PSEU|nr:NAD(P)-binding domain-containing protein [Amycolatopsis pithecellobii]MTD54313.1 SidA/IucD/PvdA family monooxygenase [Amycolatopsis pithecellobii]
MSTETQAPDRVCVVGAGPSGLVIARQLREAGIAFDVYEKHSDVGGIWDPENEGSPVYRTAHFISSKYSSGFYGYPMPDDYPDYPSWRQLRDYIRHFATEEKLYEHITFNTPVERAELLEDGSWLVTVGGERKRYRALVAAPGVTWHPNVPELPGRETFTGRILHSSQYFDSSVFVGKTVLVVGAGNSGVDIACDAAVSADRAMLSVRRGYRFVPKHLFGVPLDVFLNYGGKAPAGITVPEDVNELVDAIVGDVTRFGLPAPDHDVLSSHPIVNDQIIHYFNHGDITAKPDVARLDGSDVVFTDGSREQVDVVLLATGYEYKIPFVDEALFEWKSGHPQLYLNIFNRTVDSLYVLGFIEFADAAYKRFEEMAQLVAMDLKLSGADKNAFTDMKRTHRPDLRGGRYYIDTPRHANYVETHAYQAALHDVRHRFGVPGLDGEPS